MLIGHPNRVRKGLTAEQKRARRANIQAAAKRRAKVRQCPSCARLNALVRVKSADGVIVVAKCRWCQWERVTHA